MAGRRFIGRRRELDVLQEGYDSPRSELCVVYGRRRIGKTTLLEEFVRGKPAFFYLAGKETKRHQLRRFVAELGQAVGDPLTAKVAVASWEEALTLLDRSVARLLERRGGGKAVVVLDEFQLMCNGAPELLSDLQRFWDTRWKDRGDLYLIVCGSAISFMLGEVLSQKSPLFGRRTRSFSLGPFSIAETSRMLAGRGLFEVAEAYLAVGGVPKYLEVLGDERSFRSAMSREAFSPAGFFFNEVRFMLGEQLRETENYFLVLQHLAAGARRVVDLEQATGTPSGQIMHYLERLVLLGFVSRHTPLGSRPTSKTVLYRLDDYYLRFYFTFIHPNREAIQRSSAAIPFDRLAARRWDAYAGIGFEQLARDHAHLVAARLGHELRTVGSYWRRPTKREAGVQIDLLVGCDDRTTLVCECKWSRRRVGAKVADALRTKAALFPNRARDTLRLVVVAAGGVTSAVKRQDDIAVVELGDLLAE
jgi:AAA+ ATPase superfamily predicted ATPase